MSRKSAGLDFDNSETQRPQEMNVVERTDYIRSYLKDMDPADLPKEFLNQAEVTRRFPISARVLLWVISRWMVRFSQDEVSQQAWLDLDNFLKDQNVPVFYRHRRPADALPALFATWRQLENLIGYFMPHALMIEQGINDDGQSNRLNRWRSQLFLWFINHLSFNKQGEIYPNLAVHSPVARSNFELKRGFVDRRTAARLNLDYMLTLLRIFELYPQGIIGLIAPGAGLEQNQVGLNGGVMKTLGHLQEAVEARGQDPVYFILDADHQASSVLGQDWLVPYQTSLSGPYPLEDRQQLEDIFSQG